MIARMQNAGTWANECRAAAATGPRSGSGDPAGAGAQRRALVAPGRPWVRTCSRPSRRAMTLVEIMIVVVILGVMAAVAVPSMRGMHERNKLRAASREIVALAKTARAEAVFGERTTELILDLDKQTFRLDLRVPDEEESTAKKFTSGGRKSSRKKTKSRLEELRDLSGGVKFLEVHAYDENIIKDKLVAIDFHPDGSASPTLFSLTNNRGQTLTVEVLKATGQMEITEGTVEQKLASIEEAAATLPPPPSSSASGGGAYGGY